MIDIEKFQAWIAHRGEIQRTRRELWEKNIDSIPISSAYCVVLPDLIERGLVHEIFKMIEDKGFRFKRVRLVSFTEEEVRSLYNRYNEEILSRILPRLVDRQCIFLEVEGFNVSRWILKNKGFFAPSFANPNSIRGRLSISLKDGVSLHTCDTQEERETINNILEKK